MTVAQIMDPDLLHSRELAASFHLVIEEVFGVRKHPVALFQAVNSFCVFLDHIGAEGRYLDGADAFFRFGLRDNILLVEAGVCLVNVNLTPGYVYVFEGQSQSLTGAHTRPEKKVKKNV